MIAGHTLALSFILPDDVYFLANESPTPVDMPIETPPTTQVAEPEATYAQLVKFNYTGGYQKKFLVLVHYPEHEAMEPAHLNALESTIKRKDMAFTDVAIFNISKYPGTDIDAVLNFFKPAKILLLSKNALPAGLKPLALNQLTQQGEYSLLYSFGFNEMMGNKENTKAFWEQMKLL